jgi:ParB family chromosome partitioning protein
LTKEEQRELLEAMNYAQSTPSVSQAQRIKKLSKAGELTKKHMEDILSEIKKEKSQELSLIMHNFTSSSHTITHQQ